MTKTATIDKHPGQDKHNELTVIDEKQEALKALAIATGKAIRIKNAYEAALSSYKNRPDKLEYPVCNAVVDAITIEFGGEEIFKELMSIKGVLEEGGIFLKEIDTDNPKLLFANELDNDIFETLRVFDWHPESLLDLIETLSTVIMLEQESVEFWEDLAILDNTRPDGRESVGEDIIKLAQLSRTYKQGTKDHNYVHGLTNNLEE